MDTLAFTLVFNLHAQENGTMVATCDQIPILAAGDDHVSLADELIKVLQRVVARLEAMDDSAAAQRYLAEHGVESKVVAGPTSIGVDAPRLRTQLKEWAARQVSQSTLHCAIAA